MQALGCLVELENDRFQSIVRHHSEHVGLKCPRASEEIVGPLKRDSTFDFAHLTICGEHTLQLAG